MFIDAGAFVLGNMIGGRDLTLVQAVGVKLRGLVGGVAPLELESLDCWVGWCCSVEVEEVEGWGAEVVCLRLPSPRHVLGSVFDLAMLEDTSS